ncbi:MAG TPA: hypothetical protein VIU33_03220, partial [Nitrospiria bacterium]
MKKSVLLGAGLILIGVFLLLGVQKNTLASHDPNANYDPALGVGTPEDSVADSTPDKPGSDFDNDRTPDRTAGDRGTTDAGDNLRDRSPNSDRDGNRDDGPAGGQNGAPDRSAQQSRNKDRTPDCGDGPGDGSCGNSPASGDDRRDNFGAGDDLEDEIPDRPRAINRVGDNVSDESPDRTNEEGYLADNGMPLTINDRRGARDCATADQAVGECDNNTTNQIDDNFEDRVGRSGSEDWALDGSGSDATPDKNIAAESDNPNRPARDGDSFGSQGDGTASRISAAIRDGAPDKTASRPRTNGWHNHSQAARDTFQEGARDYSPDNKSDQGSLGFAALAVSTADETSGGEGAAGSTGPAGAKGSDGDTCSFVAGSSSDPMKTGAQLGLLLGPLALVWMIRNRKKGGRMNKGVSLGLGALLISGGLLMAGPAQAAHDPQAGFNPAFSGAPQDDVADHIADRPGSDKMNMDRNPDRTSRDRNTADAGDGNEDRSQNMDNESPFRDDGPAGGQNGTPDRTGNRDGGGAQSPGPGVNGSNRPGGVRDATPDCGNGPGDGNCGNGPSAGDNTQDNFGAGDDLADNSPDRPIGFNRIGDDVGDELPEKAHSDRLIILNGGTLVRDRVNARDCNAEDVAQGECDDRLANNPDEGFRDRVGREGNNHDWTLDGKNRLGIPDKDISGADDPRRVARDGNSNGAGCDFNC